MQEQASKAAEFSTPPHNFEVEQGLLGALLIANRGLDLVEEILDPHHFFDPLHGDLYARITALRRAGRLASPVTLGPAYANAEPIRVDLTVGQYLGQLAARAVASTSLVDYARLIRDLALRRLLIVVAEDVQHEASDLSTDRSAEAVLERAESRLHEVAPSGPNQRGLISLADSLDHTIRAISDRHANGGALGGIPTGFRDLDNMLGGLRKGTLTILAARPSMGKTALATGSMRAMALAGHAVAFFSLEMSRDELNLRLLSGETGIPVPRLQTGMLADGEMRGLIDAQQRLGNLPLIIDESSALTTAQIHSRARRLSRQGRLDALCVDYIGLIKPSSAYAGNRVNEVSEITAGLKALAKELDIPVLALSQLNRNVEHRDNKRPTLSDLRDSGSIEQDADVVAFLFRDEYYVEREKPAATDPTAYADWLTACEAAAGKAELTIAKNRQGPIGTIDLMFDARTTSFASAT